MFIQRVSDRDNAVLKRGISAAWNFESVAAVHYRYFEAKEALGLLEGGRGRGGRGRGVAWR